VNIWGSCLKACQSLLSDIIGINRVMRVPLFAEKSSDNGLAHQDLFGDVPLWQNLNIDTEPGTVGIENLREAKRNSHHLEIFLFSQRVHILSSTHSHIPNSLYPFSQFTLSFAIITSLGSLYEAK